MVDINRIKEKLTKDTYSKDEIIEIICTVAVESLVIGTKVINTRSGKDGVIIGINSSGSIQVLESINPYVINTHDSMKTLTVIDDNFENTTRFHKNSCNYCQNLKFHSGKLYLCNVKSIVLPKELLTSMGCTDCFTSNCNDVKEEN